MARFDLGQPGSAQLERTTLFPYGQSGAPSGQFAFFSDGAFAISGDFVVTAESTFPLVDALPVQPHAETDWRFASVFAPDGRRLRFSSFLTQGAWPRIAPLGSNGLVIGLDSQSDGLATAGAYRDVRAGGMDLLLMKITGIASSGPNEAPVLDEIFPFVANATSLGGASLEVFAAGFEPDRDQLTVMFTGPSGSFSYVLMDRPGDRFVAIAPLTFPIGTSTFTVRIDDGRGGVATRSGAVTILGSIGSGTGVVTVTPPPLLDSAFLFGDPTYAPIARWTMENAAGSTVTTLNVRTNGLPALPGGYQLGSPPYYYDFVTLPASGPYTACIDIVGMSFSAPGDARLFHHADGAWTDVTTYVTTQEICGRASTAGTFALLHPAVDANRATTIAGSGFGRDTIDGPGGDLRDDLVDGHPATASVLHSGDGGLAFDAVRGLLYTTTFAQIRRVNLHTGILDTIAGDGAIGSFQVDPLTGASGIPSVNGVDARSTHVTNPSQLALDAQGHIYFSEYCQVRRVDRKTNIVTLVAGDGFCEHRGDGGLATAARVNGAHGPLAIDAAGDLLVGETGRIRRIDSAGLITTVAGNGSTVVMPGPALESGLALRRFSFAPNGDLYIVQLDGLLLRLTAGADGLVNGGPGETLSVINGCALDGSCPDSRFGGDGDVVRRATFRTLTTLAVEPNGDVLVGDFADHRIRRISAGADGVLTGEADDEVVVTAAGYNAQGRSGNGFFTLYRGEDFALSSTVVTNWAILADPRGGFFYVNGSIDLLRRVGAAAAPIPNQPPIANAGPDQTVESQGGGSEIAHLDGRGSSDPEDEALTFVWSENGTPFGSGPELDVVLSEGTHVITLTVTDTAAHSASDTVTVTVGGLAPVVVEITETITVTDGPNVLPARMVNITETITVTDTPIVLPAAMVNVTETIHVDDDVALIVTGADLSIAVFTDPTAVVDLGGTLRYTVIAANHGPAIATGVAISMPVLTTFAISAVDAPGTVCEYPLLGSAGTLTCRPPNPIQPGTHYLLTVDVIPSVVGSLSNTFRVSGVPADPEPGNNEVSSTVTARAATDLGIAVSPSRTLLNVGESLAYTVTITNSGSLTATGVGFSVQPTNLTIDQVELPPLACTFNIFSGLHGCSLGTIAPGASGAVQRAGDRDVQARRPPAPSPSRPRKPIVRQRTTA